MASISGSFRGIPDPILNGQLRNLVDQPAIGPTSAHTAGCTLVDSLPLQPSLAGPWTIIGWTIGFDLWAILPVAQPAYGRFGNIVGGLCHTPSPTQGAGAPWVSPILPFPTNASLISQIWDGDQSPSPPVAYAGSIPSSAARIALSYPLPQPVDLQPGDQLSMGIWLMSSVVRTVGLVLLNATWTVGYEERPVGDRPTWGV
jgi:hypothetical protein